MVVSGQRWLASARAADSLKSRFAPQLFLDARTPLPELVERLNAYRPDVLSGYGSLIGILAGILLPALTKAKVAARVTQSKTEIQGLKGAIESYYSTYQRYPTSQQVRKDGVSNFNPDYTYGTWNTTPPAGGAAYAPQLHSPERWISAATSDCSSPCRSR